MARHTMPGVTMGYGEHVLMSNHYHIAPRMSEVARGLEKYLETASRLVGRTATRRVVEEGFSAMVKAVDAAIIDSFGKR